MITALAEAWTSWLIRHGASSENREVILYGMIAAINEILANIFVFTIAFLLNVPLEMLIWQIFWLALRVNLGGHHANSHLLCLIESTALAVACVLLLPYIVTYVWLIPAEIAITLIVAFFFSPFIHPNRQASEEHKNRVKKRGRITAVIQTILITLFYIIFPAWVAHISALGMFAATALCVIGKISYQIHQQK